MSDRFDAAIPVSDDEIARRARRRLVRLKAFYGHLAVYVAVNVLLHAINLMTAHRYWAIWPLLGWGLAIALQASATFDWPARLLAPDWEDRKLRDFVDDERRKAGMAAARPPAPARD
ncbi:MAG: 2TM domain-containing protein [Alphaproteobacteria bacterium]|nr:2TM domain-containing protein [Alphaproteobacteria bacterium]